MKYFLSALLVSFSVFGLAQREQHVDLNIAVGEHSHTISSQVVKNFKLLKSEKLHLGLGVRLAYTFGNLVEYTTAPAKHTKSMDAIDTIRVENPMLFSTNLSLNASYHFTNKWSIGCNIDAIGFSFGKKTVANYYPSFASQSETPARKQLLDEKITPTVNNFLVFGNYTKGSICAEAFIRYTHKDRYSYKLGYGHYTSEYESSKRIGHNDNYRFRNTSAKILIGFGYSFI